MNVVTGLCDVPQMSLHFDLPVSASQKLAGAVASLYNVIQLVVPVWLLS